jgi:hypothetical protein
MMTSHYRTSTNPGGYNSTAHVTPTGYYIALRQQLQASRAEIVAVRPTQLRNAALQVTTGIIMTG